MSRAAVGTLLTQFGPRVLDRMALEFAFPSVPTMVQTWGYRRTYYMATVLEEVYG